MRDERGQSAGIGVARRVDAWLEARQALERAMPWTAEWLRLRMLEQDRRPAYIALMDRSVDVGDETRVEPSSPAERWPARRDSNPRPTDPKSVALIH